MVEDQKQDEIVVRFDSSGESLVLSESEDDHHPGAFAGEARVEVDPLVEAFARSPYDPVIGAMMMGRATGEVIKRPPERSWMRPVAYLLAIGMVGQFAAAIYFAFAGGSRVLAGETLSGLVFALVFAIGGALLLYRLSRR